MFFLMRTTFWLTLVLVLISFGSEEKTEASVDPIKAFFAAQATVADLGGFCGRNPQVCETGGEALSAIGSRAREGARLVYEFLGDQTAESDVTTEVAVQDVAPGLTTGSIGQSIGTLTAQDMTLPWQGSELSDEKSPNAIGPVPRPNPRAI